MEAREYILGLMAIISGLAISDMVQSLHGLLERARRVRWAWAPLATAAFVLVTIVYSWWAAWEADLVPISLWAFLLLLGQQIALVLAAKAALPDPALARTPAPNLMTECCARGRTGQGRPIGPPLRGRAKPGP